MSGVFRAWQATWLAFPCLLAGAMVVSVSLQDLSRTSDLIVVGRVESVTPEQQGVRVMSVAVIGVEQVIKGNATGKVAVQFAGGRVGDLEERPADSPNYRKGEHVVAFLRRMPDTTRYTTNANSQGKFNVVRDRIGPDQTPLKGFIERVARELTDGSVR
jgi:hypothetical protein